MNHKNIFFTNEVLTVIYKRANYINNSKKIKPWPKKAVLSLEIGRMKIPFHHLPAHTVKCISEYIYFCLKQKHTHTSKKQKKLKKIEKQKKPKKKPRK